MADQPTPAYGKGFQVFLAAVVAAAVTGYFTGLRHAPRSEGDARPAEGREYRLAAESAEASSSGWPLAVGYAELPEAPRGPNRDFRPTLEGLKPPAPLSPDEERPPARVEEIAEALSARASRRAFDGAPPVVPHRITQIEAEGCLACHGEGAKIGDIAAPKMCHQTLASCTQCHVEAKPGGGGVGETLPDPFGENAFVGREPPLQGERAWPGAPPTIPHTTWMRSDCLSCHGPAGAQAIQTEHPWRQSCTQCHAPNADLDQRPYLP